MFSHVPLFCRGSLSSSAFVVAALILSTAACGSVDRAQAEDAEDSAESDLSSKNREALTVFNGGTKVLDPNLVDEFYTVALVHTPPKGKKTVIQQNQHFASMQDQNLTWSKAMAPNGHYTVVFLHQWTTEVGGIKTVHVDPAGAQSLPVFVPKNVKHVARCPDQNFESDICADSKGIRVSLADRANVASSAVTGKLTSKGDVSVMAHAFWGRIQGGELVLAALLVDAVTGQVVGKPSSLKTADFFNKSIGSWPNQADPNRTYFVYVTTFSAKRSDVLTACAEDLARFAFNPSMLHRGAFLPTATEQSSVFNETRNQVDVSYSDLAPASHLAPTYCPLLTAH